MNTASHPFRVANYRAFWLSRLTLTLAQYSMLLIIGWQTYNLARDSGMSVGESAGQLALIGLLQFIPLLLLTPFSGLAADRFDRRNLGRLTILLQLMCGVTLAALTWSDRIDLPVLYTVAVVLGISRAFAGPALAALAPNLVPAAILPNAIALSSIAWQVGMIVGPAVGGVLYEVAPPLPYAAASALFIVSMIALSAVGDVPRGSPRSTDRPIRQIRDGLSYVVRNKMVLGAITLDLFAVFLAGATALFPVYARDILHVGATGLSQLAMAPAVGAALTALWFSFHPLKNNVGPKMLWSVAVFGAATIVFGVSTSMPLSLAMLFIIGAADMFSVYIRQSLIQLHTPDDKRGRVSAVSQMTIGASNEFGDFFSGSLAYLIGPVAAVVAGGAGAIITVAAWAKIFPVLRTTRTFDPPEELLITEPNDPLNETAKRGPES
ncbi:putative transmembrane protein [Aurantiacibacter atlanticus]|uniref:Multidrug efflux pump Tap n=1 Tax=Aurantiacibacter atlanticus TaxID=1648404 RepID=A0A0H4VF63_9SPHN|nr:MFS transporter [Aurantiacibacter atlanticus]AKQ43357.1 putative transmembrane protein [Aurantiacibacter atlanticus]MDF1833693.1 MFS transporter [Alteraurantiacibacter sp. bin_em_oilr2.035]